MELRQLEYFMDSTRTLGTSVVRGSKSNLVSEQLFTFYTEYPDIQVSINSSEDLLTLLKDNNIDFAITYSQKQLDYDEKQLIKIPLYEETEPYSFKLPCASVAK